MNHHRQNHAVKTLERDLHGHIWGQWAVPKLAAPQMYKKFAIFFYTRRTASF